jgi:hypothetical protein
MTTPYTQLVLIWLAIILLGGCAAPRQATVERTTVDFELAGDDVSLGFTNLPLDRFLELAERITEDAYVCDRSLVATTEPFSVTGQLRCQRDEFGEFVQTMLYSRGLVLEPEGEGAERRLSVRRVTDGS